MNKQKAWIAVSLSAVILSIFVLCFSVFCCLRAVDSLRETVGTVYAQDPEAAELLLRALLERRSGDGVKAAEQLGLTGRAYTFYLRSLYPAGWILSGIAVLLILTAALIILLGRCRKNELNYRDRLRKRIDAAAAGREHFYTEREEETLYHMLLLELDRVREQSDIRAKEQRIYVENVAHEIKTPAAGLVLTLDLMEQSGMNPERLARARESIGRIQRYVGELLILARLRSGKLHFAREPVDLNELLDQTLGAYPAIERSGPEAPVFIWGDRDRLGEAIENLLRNALRHSNSPADVKVSLEKTGEEVRIRISDTGSAEIPAVERYVVGKEDGSSTGIGLSLVRETVERHYGHLSFSGREDERTNVDMVFPLYSLKNSAV